MRGTLQRINTDDYRLNGMLKVALAIIYWRLGNANADMTKLTGTLEAFQRS